MDFFFPVCVAAATLHLLEFPKGVLAKLFILSTIACFSDAWISQSGGPVIQDHLFTAGEFGRILFFIARREELYFISELIMADSGVRGGCVDY